MAEALADKRKDAHAPNYAGEAAALEKRIDAQIAAATGNWTLALQSISYASKDSLERIFDWKGRGAKEYRQKIDDYWNTLDKAKTEAVRLKIAINSYARIAGPEMVDYARTEFARSGKENFSEWAAGSKDRDLRALGRALSETAEAGDALRELVPQIARMEKELKVETALSVAVAVASVVPTGGLAAKGAGKLAETFAAEAGGVFAKEGFKKGAAFTGGFILENAAADTAAIAITGADPLATMKEAMPGYLLGIGLMGGTRALARLGKEHADLLKPVREKIASKVAVMSLATMETTRKALAQGYAFFEAKVKASIEEESAHFRKHIETTGKKAELAKLQGAVMAEYRKAIEEMPALREALDEGMRQAAKVGRGWQACAYMAYEKGYGALRKLGFSEEFSKAFSALSAMPDAKRYSHGSHALGVSELTDFLADKGNYSNPLAILHDVGKAGVSGRALRGASPLHEFGWPGIEVGIKEGHLMLQEGIIEAMRKAGAMGDADYALYAKNRGLFERAFNHHSYSKGAYVPKIKADMMFADVTNATLSFRPYHELGSIPDADGIYRKAAGIRNDPGLAGILRESGVSYGEMSAKLAEFNSAYGKEMALARGANEAQLNEMARRMESAYGMEWFGAYFKGLVGARKIASAAGDRESAAALDYIIGLSVRYGLGPGGK